MSNPKSPSAPVFPPESPAQAAERERLLPELLKQAKASTGTVQTVLRKMHDVLVQTQPGAVVDPQVYEVAKAAFAQLGKEPNLKIPPILLQAVEFLKKRAAAMEHSGQTQPPKGAPPPPVASKAGAAPAPARPAPAAGAPPRRNTMDGFEMPKRTSSSVSLIPAVGPSEPAGQGKIEPRTGAPATIKNPGAGKVKG